MMTVSEPEVRIATVRRLDLHAGDILHVALGGDLGDDLPPWIPSPEQIREEAAAWEAVVPEGVQVVVTHYLFKIEVVSPS
jgi:hypothetical protein